MQILFDILRGNYYKNIDKVKSSLHFVPSTDKKLLPQVLWIGCSDIYMIPHLAIGLESGQVVTHHNIANQIKKEDASVQSVIQYAIETLKVKQIVVCGHYYCSSIKAALESSEEHTIEDTPVNQWMQDLKELALQNWSTLRSISSKKERANRLAELNLLAQVSKLRQNNFVKLHAHHLQILAWMFDKEKGNFVDLSSKQIITSMAHAK